MLMKSGSVFIHAEKHFMYLTTAYVLPKMSPFESMSEMCVIIVGFHTMKLVLCI